MELLAHNGFLLSTGHSKFCFLMKVKKGKGKTAEPKVSSKNAAAVSAALAAGVPAGLCQSCFKIFYFFIYLFIFFILNHFM